MAKRTLLGWVNKLDQAQLSAEGLEDLLPIQNTQSNPVALPARRIGTSLTLDFDHGSTTDWAVFAILGTNLSDGATVRLTLSNTASGDTDVFDSGTTGAGIKEGYPEIYLLLDPARTARYGRITITDSSLSFVDLGRLAGYGGIGFWEPPRGESFGRSIRWADGTQKAKSFGGQTLSTLGPRFRIAEFAIEFNPEAEMMANAFELDRRQGISGDILIMLDPENYRQELSLWGPIVQVSPLEHWTTDLVRKRYVVEQRK